MLPLTLRGQSLKLAADPVYARRMNLPSDPSLSDLQLFWERQYHNKKRNTWLRACRVYEEFILFFGAERRPRDIFRSDVTAYKEWKTKKGHSKTNIATTIDYLARFYRLLDEIEVVEAGFNPAVGMRPRIIRETKKATE